MKKHWAMLLSVGVVFSATTILSARAADTKDSVKAIMGALNKGPKSVHEKVKTALKADEPNWEGIEKATKEYAELSDAMTKLKPKKGDGASWEKLSGIYAADAKELDEAAKAKDKPAAEASLKKLGASCKGCHMPHK